MSAKRILYIEDNKMNLRLVRRLLTAYGYILIESENGLDGIAVADRERPDLILMDINLPGIDGIEATARLKQNPDLAHIPIIALTAAAMKGDRERILAAGCNDYMTKPIDTTLLLETVRRYIDAGEPKLAEIASKARTFASVTANSPANSTLQSASASTN